MIGRKVRGFEPGPRFAKTKQTWGTRRHNIEGVVTLYAVIHSDGSVGDVKVLRSIDDRLDEYARNALSRWRFRPATKNGTPVDLEAVVTIQFKPSRLKSSF